MTGKEKLNYLRSRKKITKKKHKMWKKAKDDFNGWWYSINEEPHDGLEEGELFLTIGVT